MRARLNVSRLLRTETVFLCMSDCKTVNNERKKVLLARLILWLHSAIWTELDISLSGEICVNLFLSRFFRFWRYIYLMRNYPKLGLKFKTYLNILKPKRYLIIRVRWKEHTGWKQRIGSQSQAAARVAFVCTGLESTFNIFPMAI